MNRIFVMQAAIAATKKDGVPRPPIVVRDEETKRGEAFNTVQIDGPCKIVYDPNGTCCGRQVFIETESEVTGEQ